MPHCLHGSLVLILTPWRLGPSLGMWTSILNLEGMEANLGINQGRMGCQRWWYKYQVFSGGCSGSTSPDTTHPTWWYWQRLTRQFIKTIRLLTLRQKFHDEFWHHCLCSCPNPKRRTHSKTFPWLVKTVPSPKNWPPQHWHHCPSQTESTFARTTTTGKFWRSWTNTNNDSNQDKMVCKFCGGEGQIIPWEEDSSSQAMSDKDGDSTVLKALIPTTNDDMANDNKFLSIRGRGGTLHHQVPIVEDISVPCKWDNSQESKLYESTSPDALLPGEVYVCFPPGSGKNTDTYYSCFGWMSEHDQVHPVPGFDPKTQKQVLRTIWKPRTMTFQYALNTIPPETLNQAKGKQLMWYCLEEIVDVDRQCLYFASEAAQMCHIYHYQTAQQAHLTASQLKGSHWDSNKGWVQGGYCLPLPPLSWCVVVGCTSNNRKVWVLQLERYCHSPAAALNVGWIRKTKDMSAPWYPFRCFVCQHLLFVFSI